MKTVKKSSGIVLKKWGFAFQLLTTVFIGWLIGWVIFVMCVVIVILIEEDIQTQLNLVKGTIFQYLFWPLVAIPFFVSGFLTALLFSKSKIFYKAIAGFVLGANLGVWIYTIRIRNGEETNIINLIIFSALPLFCYTITAYILNRYKQNKSETIEEKKHETNVKEFGEDIL